MATPIPNTATARCPACYEEIVAEVQAEISYRGAGVDPARPPLPEHLFQARDHDAALAQLAELRRLVEAAGQALAAWEAGVEERGAPRRDQ